MAAPAGQRLVQRRVLPTLLRHGDGSRLGFRLLTPLAEGVERRLRWFGNPPRALAIGIESVAHGLPRPFYHRAPREVTCSWVFPSVPASVEFGDGPAHRVISVAGERNGLGGCRKLGPDPPGRARPSRRPTPPSSRQPPHLGPGSSTFSLLEGAPGHADDAVTDEPSAGGEAPQPGPHCRAEGVRQTLDSREVEMTPGA
jgi:hypothetical protein